MLPATHSSHVTPSSPSNAPSRASEHVASVQALHQIEQLLLLGNRSDAVKLASENKLWAHALVLASCVGKDVWKETVSSFIQDQLGHEASNEGLRVAYGLFAGLGRQAGKDRMVMLKLGLFD
jgi:hypothetical protein